MTMPPGLRRFALAAHLTLSVGWIGAVAAYMALDLATATSQDAQTLRAAYLGMELIVRNVIVPLALASLLTGLVMALGTKWGLFRHYWVLISLLLTAGVCVVATSAQVATWAVATTAGEQHDDNQHDQDDADDPKHLHPAWCPWGSILGRPHAGVGGAGRVSHLSLLVSRVVGQVV